MISVNLKKGYTLKILGRPASSLQKSGTPAKVAVLPERIPFIKPRLSVKVGDAVKVGTALFEDKRNPDIKFLSPGGGTIEQINFGPRRVIKEVVVGLDETEAFEQFASLNETDLDAIDREDLIRLIIDGGLWPLLKALPFRDMANPQVLPPAIFVSLGNMQPFFPQPHVYLQDREADFQFGLHALQKIAPERVYVTAAHNRAKLPPTLDGHVTHTYAGNYPAHDPGVMVYFTRKSAADNQSWFIDGQDVLLLAQLLKNGTYPTMRTVVVAGSAAPDPKHFSVRMGVPLNQIVSNQFGEDEVRFIAGGVFTGYTRSADSFLGLHETSLLLLPEGHAKGEFLGFIRPGYRKPSYSRAFLSCLNQKDLEMNCNKHGGDRACIACYYCAEVCPVDILVHFTFKAVLAGEVEESLEHGLLDCVECGLCSYVCPAKLELFETLKNAKAEFYREQLQP